MREYDVLLTDIIPSQACDSIRQGNYKRVFKVISQVVRLD